MTMFDAGLANKEMTMRKSIITTIVAGLIAATSVQPSYAAGARGIGSYSVGATRSPSGISNEAGSIAAGANSALDPSGNPFLLPPPGTSAGFEFVRPHR
jgi:hypothetical protein